jgi:hypothetical protein
MTTKLPSGLAASGPAEETDSEQITKEHSDENEDIVVDPSDDVTVEAAEDVTSEAVAGTPPPSLRHTPAPIVGDGGTPAPRLASQTLLGVPIQSLPLPGVTAASSRSEFLDEHEEVTAMAPSIVDDLLARGPSITDDDEEETKVEPAETAIKAAASVEDVSSALSAQASVQREKALRRASPPMMATAPTSSDLEFEDPAGDDDDDGEVLSASAADEIEDDEDEEATADEDADVSGADDAATGTFAKPVDSTGFSGLLNARRSPPMGSPFGRDGFGSARLPTPSPGYAIAAATAPAPSTSPFSARLSPVPAGSPYGARATQSSMPAIQIPAPSAAPATTAGTGLFSRVQVPAYVLAASAIAFFGLGFGTRAMVAPSRAPQTVVVTKTVTVPATAPSVEPVQPTGSGTMKPPIAGSPPTTPAVVEPTTPPPGIEPDGMPLPRPVKKVAAVKPRKAADDALAEEAVLKPAKLTASVSKPAPAPVAKAAATPTPVAGAKPAKKPTKVWIDPFAQ